MLTAAWEFTHVVHTKPNRIFSLLILLIHSVAYNLGLMLKVMGAVPGVLVLVLCGMSFLAGRYIQQAGELPSPNEVRFAKARRGIIVPPTCG